MKKLIKTSVIGLIAAGALLASAMVHAQELKVGYVDVQALAAKAPQTKAAKEEIEKEFTLKKKELDSLQSEYEALAEKWRRDSLTMNDSERKELQDQMLVKERQLRWKKGIFDEDFKIRQGEFERKLRQQIYKAIVKIAQEGKYDLVLSDGVLFASSRINITETVLEELKKGGK